MILRLLRAGIPDGAGPALLARLREEVVPATRRIAGLMAFTYGIRHEAGQTRFLALSSWRDFSDIVAVSGVGLDRPVRPVRLEDLLTDISIEHSSSSSRRRRAWWRWTARCSGWCPRPSG